MVDIPTTDMFNTAIQSLNAKLDKLLGQSPTPTPVPSTGQSVIAIGPSRQFKRVSEALSMANKAQVRFELDPGIYEDRFALDGLGLVQIVGMGNSPADVILDAKSSLIQEKAAIFGNNRALQLFNFTITGGKNGDNGAAVRNGSMLTEFLVNDMALVDNENHILFTDYTKGADFPNAADTLTVKVNNLLMDHGGQGTDGRTHNAYISHHGLILDMTGVVSRNSGGGHALKLRWPVGTIKNSTFQAAREGRCIDVNNGGTLLVTGCTLIKDGTGESGDGQRQAVGIQLESVSVGTTLQFTMEDCSISAPAYVNPWGVHIANGGPVFGTVNRITAKDTPIAYDGIWLIDGKGPNQS